MNYLIIDTSCDCLTIALKKDNKLFGYKSEQNRKGHSTVLLPAINDLLVESNLKISDIDFFGAVVGPGSFTGVRVGVATVNAFGYSTSKPVISVTAFEPFTYNMQAGSVAIDGKHAYFVANVLSENKLEYYTKEEYILPNDCSLLNPNNITPEMLASIMEYKIENKIFDKEIRPFYMRESEAERNLKK